MNTLNRLKFLQRFSIRELNCSHTLICLKKISDKSLTSMAKKTKFVSELTKLKGKAFIYDNSYNPN